MEGITPPVKLDLIHMLLGLLYGDTYNFIAQ